MKLGETLKGLSLSAKPKPIDGGYTFLVTECTTLNGKSLYATYERAVPASAIKFTKTRAGFKLAFVGNPFEDLEKKLTNEYVEDIFLYPRFT